MFRFELKSAGLEPFVVVDINIYGFGEPMTSQVAKHVGIEEIGLAVATACISAHRKVCVAEARIAKIVDARDAAPPIKDWPIEEVGERFCSVNHDLRLMAQSSGSIELAQEFAPHWPLHDLNFVQMRERYDAAFPAPDAEQDPTP